MAAKVVEVVGLPVDFGVELIGGDPSSGVGGGNMDGRCAAVVTSELTSPFETYLAADMVLTPILRAAKTDFLFSPAGGLCMAILGAFISMAFPNEGAFSIITGGGIIVCVV